MDKVSIVIPVYNCGNYVEEAIESALNQTYKNKEITIVDDGSTDQTSALISQYQGLVKIITKPNEGTATALNTGIRASTGQWIKWLSADDVLYPNAIEFMMLLATEKNVIYYTHYDIINASGIHVGEFIEPGRNESDLWSFFFGNGSTSLIHMNVFNEVGLFDESLRHSEDYEFWLRASQVYHKRLVLIPLKTIKYRNHPDQLTNKVGGSNDDIIRNKIRGMMNG